MHCLDRTADLTFLETVQTVFVVNTKKLHLYAGKCRKIIMTKVCSRHLGHMTKMAATPIYGKDPSKIFSGTGGRFPRNLVCSIGTSCPSLFIQMITLE